MKIAIGPISIDIPLLFRLCWPAVVFIVLCTGIFIAFDPVLLWLDVVAPWFIGWAWLSLLVLYIVLGIAFILFTGRRLRGFYGSEPMPVQRRMATLSGRPFYGACLLFVLMNVSSMLDPDIGGAAAFFAAAGLVLFMLTSFVYWLLLCLLLRDPATSAHPTNETQGA